MAELADFKVGEYVSVDVSEHAPSRLARVEVNGRILEVIENPPSLRLEVRVPVLNRLDPQVHIYPIDRVGPPIPGLPKP